MSRENIRETVLHILGNIVPDASTTVVDPDVSFHDQFEMDSVDYLRLMMELEKDLQVTIFDFDYPKLSTLNGCQNYLSERLTEQ